MNSYKLRTDQLNDELLPLFPDLPKVEGKRSRKYKRLHQLIWSDHKARFIQHYPPVFRSNNKARRVHRWVRRSTTLSKLDAWTASLVLASEPEWLRNFYLCELAPDSVKCLRDLITAQPVPMSKSGHKLPRKIQVVPGDFNKTIDENPVVGSNNPEGSDFLSAGSAYI